MNKKKKMRELFIPPSRSDEDKAIEDKKAIRDRLEKQIEEYLKNGGKIDVK